MLMIVVVVLVAAGLIGAVLLAAGLRGRRLDDHPVCRACRFDLHGLPDPQQCPECGADLHTPHAVRIGNRRRKPGFIAAGAVLLLLVLGAGGAGGWLTSRGVNWNQYKPTWLLRLEARPGASGLQGVLTELTSRMSKGMVPAPTAKQLAERALAVQADPTIRWDPCWGDVIEEAWKMSAIDDAEAMRYVKQAMEVELRFEQPKGDAAAGRGTNVTMIRNLTFARAGRFGLFDASVTLPSMNGVLGRPSMRGPSTRMQVTMGASSTSSASSFPTPPVSLDLKQTESIPFVVRCSRGPKAGVTVGSGTLEVAVEVRETR